ncbi:MAG TPA: adenylate/guanylate cyclase domain-containing protein [Actinomycetota bacterium]|nr:adenylate/guanylate cyclase domain-containing protein [Actinomycetota bacterium]
MAVICGSCGHVNLDGGKFCSECAGPLAAPPARKERKFATALFADLVGSTTLAEQEDPEVVQAAIGSVFDRLAKVIVGYGGLIEKYMGDAILAVFGVPIVHEDDPERAIRAGLDMQAVLSEMNRVAATESKPELEMRIGIEAGDIVVDLERAGSRRDRMLTGDAVNTAARLQSSAEIGRVLVGPTAQSSARGTIDFSDPEMLDLKGKAAPVAAYTALRITAQRAGDRASLGIESRMVGRDEESAVLQQTLHRVENEGRPALVTILAPAGSGKTRLVRELGRYVDGLDQNFFWRPGRCLPYGAAAYSALVDVIKAQCEVLDDDTVDVARAKVLRSANDLMDDEDTAVALNILLGLPADVPMGREKLFDLWRRYLERLAARYPLVLVLEDIHWADEGLLDFIEFLADWGQGAIMTVALARPELLDKRPGWGGGKRNYTAMYLDPLGPQESDDMLTDLFGDALPVDVRTMISARSEGNPLYTEEIARMLIDRAVLVHESEGWRLASRIEGIDIPRSIHALVAARVDGLTPPEKELLQDAAVVGRVFWSGVVARLAHQTSSQTREQLGYLRMKELITPREPSSFSNEHEFGFHHALIRDVAYDSLPKKLRAEKHVEVARWAASGPTADRDDIVELIATHFGQALAYMAEMGAAKDETADLQERLLFWAVRAAERSRRAWQTDHALEWYRKALDVTEQLGKGGGEAGALWEALAFTAVDVLPDEETAEAFSRAIAAYQAGGNEVGVGRAKAGYSKTLFQMGKEEAAVAMAEEAVSVLRSKNDEGSLARAVAALARLYWLSDRDEEAERLAAEATDLAGRAGDRETEALALNIRGLTLCSVEGVEAALEPVRQSHAIAREIGQLPLLLYTGHNIGLYRTDLGDSDGSGQKTLEDTLELARRHGRGMNRALLAITLCSIYARQGRFDQAEAVITQAVEEAPQTWARLAAGFEIALGLVDAYRGDLPAARAHIDKAASHSSSDTNVRVGIASVSALVAYLQGADAEALALTRDVVALRADDVVADYPDVLRNAVKLSVTTGDRDEAGAFRDLFDKPGLAARAFRKWCDALLATEPVSAVALFEEAAELFEELRIPFFRAGCLMDLAHANSHLGLDHVDPLREAMAFFKSSGADLQMKQASRLEG